MGNCLRISVCIFLVLLAISYSESRLLDPSLVRRNLIRSIQEMGEKEVYNVRQGNESMNKFHFHSKRVSPGGPDPHHHFKNQ
ncbi:hypothetical protein MANES_16G035800v8 [Manihot esculenta]|uniref:Uncharacterized protein n=1 Tax=Manihot esculenta TaxID=3983 RepID=A0A2C9U8J3_MANES|nr:hypothetical protein MANES_16G035800v8 [Manihot esculenta]